MFTYEETDEKIRERISRLESERKSIVRDLSHQEVELECLQEGHGDYTKEERTKKIVDLETICADLTIKLARAESAALDAYADLELRFQNNHVEIYADVY